MVISASAGKCRTRSASRSSGTATSPSASASSQVVMVPSKAGGGDGKAITVSGEAHGPQRGNALGLLLADGKCGQAERGDQRAGLGLDEARHHRLLDREDVGVAAGADDPKVAVVDAARRRGRGARCAQ